MNERINELAKRAGARIHGPRGYANILVNERDATHLMRKFAELIVKECADKVDHILCEKSKGGGSYGDYIRRNFGVE